MRNLKKILALVLALMMALSVMVFANAATFDGYQDRDEIGADYEEAVDLLTTFGIYWGSEGTFRPQDLITRAEFTALVYRTLANDPAADKLDNYAGYSDFADVAETSWAAPYINYATLMDWVAGTGSNQFTPNGNIDGHEALTILLRALGRDSKGEEITGSEWRIQAARLGAQVGLYDGQIGQLSADITREEAAYLIFTALNTPMYEYNSDTESYKKVAGETTLGKEKIGLEKITGTVTADGTDVTVETEDGSSVTVADSYAFDTGRSAYVWATKAEDATAYTVASRVYCDGVELAVKYDGETAGWTNSSSEYYVAPKDSTVTYIVDGKSGSASGINKGTEATLIDEDNDGKLDLVIAWNATVDTVGTRGVSTTTNGDTTSVVVAGVVTGTSETVVGYEGLVKDDVVLVTKPYTGITYLEKAASVTGQKTAMSGSAITFGGKSYSASELTGVENGNMFATNNTDTFNVTYTLYLDKGGYVIKAVQGEEASNTNYAVVVATSYTKNTEGGSFGSGDEAAAPYSYTATLLYTDGTSKVLNTDKLYGWTDEVSVDGISKGDKNAMGHFVTAAASEENAELSVLTLVTDGCENTDKAKFDSEDPNFGSKYFATNSTVYLIKQEDGTISRVVGYTNLPKLANSDGNLMDLPYCVVTNSSNTRQADYVYIDASDENIVSSSENDIYLWVMTAQESESREDFDGDGTVGTDEIRYTYTGLYQGSEAYTLVSEVKLTLAANSYVKVTLTDGLVAKADDVDTDTGAKDAVAAAAVSNGVLDVTSTTYVCPDSVVVYDVRGDELVVGDLSDITAGNVLTLLVDEDAPKQITTIYIEDDGEIKIAENKNLALTGSQSSATVTVAAVGGGYSVGDELTVSFTHNSGTFGTGYEFTCDLDQYGPITLEGNNTNKLEFTFPVTDAMLGQTLTVTLSMAQK